MKILHITDSHATGKAPSGRTDIYYMSFLKKMYELKYVIKQNDIKLIIHTGDLFHSSHASDKFVGQIAEIVKEYGIPMYVVPGNHDIEGYTISTLDQTKLGLLYKTGVVFELDREKNPIQLKSSREGLTICIAGQEYYKDIDTGNMHDFEMRSSGNADFNILAIHGYLCNSPQHPDVKCTQCSSIVTDADVILSGHLHEAFEYHGTDFSVYNPGSMMRVEQTTYNKKHLPQYGILEVTKVNGVVQHTYTTYPFKIAEPSEKVFDYTLKNQKKKSLITLENFKNSIANTNFNKNLNNSIENIISGVAQNLSVTPEILKRTINIYHDALNNSPDKLEVQQGFIPDVSRKIIKHVEIKNFQSHEYTLVQFKDGLNVIIGESNSGKTSILRAIRWCLDNDPKGADFITTGRDDCSVTVAFDDGTSITRKRTRTDAGTYEVLGKTVQPDGTVSMWTQTYRGFANNVPVEIANIHQMPKVNLTKDVCTSLNMMSQLDGPFLVTDSPQVKAAIIGRLTGTQIIDLAVKETNKIILNNSKTIKVWSQDIEDKNNELQRYAYLDYYERYIATFKVIITRTSEMANYVMNMISIGNEIAQREEEITNLNNLIFVIQNKIQMYLYMLSIKQWIVNQYEIINLFEEINDSYRRITMLKKKIQWITVIVSLQPFVNTYNLKVNMYSQVCDVYNRLNALQNQITIDTNIIDTSTNDISTFESAKNNLNEIVSYVNVLLKDINATEPLFNKTMERNANISKWQGIAKTQEDTIDNVTVQVGNLITEQEKLIKDNNICPCCGQKITAKKHVQSINEFMKGR